MSATRIKLPFVRSYADDDAETAMNMLKLAYLKQGAPMAPCGARVGVHISTSATDRWLLGIETLVLEALEGVAWEDGSCLKAVDVVIGTEECPPGYINIWVNREKDDE